MKHISIIFLLLSFFICQAQNSKTDRDPFILKLAVDKGNFYQQEVPKSHYFVHDKIIQIYPSEKINIEVDIKKDTIYSMTVVNKNLNPKKTIEIEFYQDTEDSIHKQMMLKVTNPFTKKLKYNALMYAIDNDKWIPTSILPVQPGLLGYEMWPNIILSLVLKDWEFE